MNQTEYLNERLTDYQAVWLDTSPLDNSAIQENVVIRQGNAVMRVITLPGKTKYIVIGDAAWRPKVRDAYPFISQWSNPRHLGSDWGLQRRALHGIPAFYAGGAGSAIHHEEKANSPREAIAFFSERVRYIPGVKNVLAGIEESGSVPYVRIATIIPRIDRPAQSRIHDIESEVEKRYKDFAFDFTIIYWDREDIRSLLSPNTITAL